jgi:MFS superfamily sulfate permease-like transporter
MSRSSTPFFQSFLARDVPASFVVFLVAMPLCMGIAVASGVSPEKGLLTGIVGGLIVGVLAGSPLQVSGPAAGLAVIVFEIVREHGLGMLGPILVLAGLIQLCAGFLRLGQWFRAISPAVVHGMLAGIGVLIVAGQVHVLLDASPRPNGMANLAAIPEAFFNLLPLNGSPDEAAFVVGVLTIAAMLGWEYLRPRSLRLVPGALIGVAVGTGTAFILSLPVHRVQVPTAIGDSITLPALADFSRMAEPSLLLTALAVAFIASAETLLSAAAVDRMHGGPRTQYERELVAQGVGNMVCGLIGGLPMTGVIVRSSANVQAGASTRLSAVMHGAWILAFITFLPWVLREVPTASLAGVLIVTGWRLVSFEHVRHLMHRYGKLPAAIWAITFATVVATDLLTGVLVGLGLAMIELVPHFARLGLYIRQRERAPGEVEMILVGAATFVQLPRLIRALEAVPSGAKVRLRARRLAYVDHTCLEMILDWADRRARSGTRVELDRQSAERHVKLAVVLSGS